MTEAATKTDLSRDALLRAAKEIKRKVQERVSETEALRRLPESTLADYRATGVNRVLQPARFGGAELDFGTMMEVCATVASGCGSSGWVLAQYCMHALMIGSWPEACQEEIWGSKPEALLSGSLVFPLGRARRVSGEAGVDASQRSMSGGVVGTGLPVRSLNRSISVRPSQLYASKARRIPVGTDRYATTAPTSAPTAATTICTPGRRSRMTATSTARTSSSRRASPARPAAARFSCHRFCANSSRAASIPPRSPPGGRSN